MRGKNVENYTIVLFVVQIPAVFMSQYVKVQFGAHTQLHAHTHSHIYIDKHIYMDLSY